MRHVFHRYRHITIVQQGNSPHIQGLEEIYCHGKRQVRSWKGPEINASLPIPDLACTWSLVTPLSDRGLDSPTEVEDRAVDPKGLWDSPRSGPSSTPNTIVVEAKPATPSLPQTWGQHTRQALTYGTRKLKQFAQNLPAALRVAWKELNR